MSECEMRAFPVTQAYIRPEELISHAHAPPAISADMPPWAYGFDPFEHKASTQALARAPSRALEGPGGYR